jgi:hypothetical protein
LWCSSLIDLEPGRGNDLAPALDLAADVRLELGRGIADRDGALCGEPFPDLASVQRLDRGLVQLGPAGGVAIEIDSDDDDIGGVVRGPNGPEADV